MRIAIPRPGPVTTLLFLAPLVAEVLPGATPPILFLLLPPVAIWETALYGCGALLVRQLACRWGGGWWTILALGAAYGLIEEGLSLKVIFNPAFEPAGSLATYGRVGDIATVFAAQIIVYHSVVSITIPILLTELMFHTRVDTQWLRRRAIIPVAALWILSLLYGYTVVHPEAPPPTYPVVIAGVIALVVLGWLVRGRRPPTDRRSPWIRRAWLFAIALAGTALFLGVTWGGPEAGRPPLLSLVGQILVVTVVVVAMRRIARATPFSSDELLALADGVLALFIVADLFKPAGAPIVALGAVIALVTLGRRLRRRPAQNQRQQIRTD